MPRTIGAYFLGATALVACPCHLPLTLPLLMAVLGGTSIGVLLSDNPLLVVVGASAYFALALTGAVWFLGRRSAAGAGGEAGGAAAGKNCCAPTARLPAHGTPGRTEVANYAES